MTSNYLLCLKLCFIQIMKIDCRYVLSFQENSEDLLFYEIFVHHHRNLWRGL